MPESGPPGVEADDMMWWEGMGWDGKEGERKKEEANVSIKKRDRPSEGQEQQQVGVCG